MSATVAQVTQLLDSWYPPEWAADWDAVGLVCGRPAAPLERVLFAVDCVEATVAEAKRHGAGLMVTHHPLMLRGVTSVAPTHYKGEIVHDLIESGIGLYVAHTNADTATPGVSDALAERLGLRELTVLAPEGDGTRGIGRIGTLPVPLSLSKFVAAVAQRLPGSAGGVRATGDPNRLITTVAVSGGAGDGYLAHAARAEVDAFVTADLRHHVVSEFAEQGGPALVDAAHWSTERPWLDVVAAQVRLALDVDTVVSDQNTDPWTIHASSTT